MEQLKFVLNKYTGNVTAHRVKCRLKSCQSKTLTPAITSGNVVKEVAYQERKGICKLCLEFYSLLFFINVGNFFNRTPPRNNYLALDV